MLEHRIEDKQQLAHTGSQGKLPGLAGGYKTCVQATEDGVASTAYQGSHIQGRTDGSPPTPDSPFTAHGATVAIEWRQSHQRSDLLTTKGAEFGQISQ